MADHDLIPVPTPDAIIHLLERFARNQDAYLAPAYNETQARREFIDPFFKALGWDVDNQNGLAEAYKDVIHEDAIKIGGATKAPDYCFRIGGTRKFFVEAKKPGVNIKADAEPAYQLRRYAWSNKLPLSILTDFEEFAVYDCRIKPDQNDKSSTARVFYCTCDQYADKWDFISGLFSKDAVLKGAYDKYAESTRGKRGTAPVDSEFLKEIEGWRDMLARNFALRNPDLSVRDLNFAVQRTIDRIVFLRMCEDRGIEIYGGLQGLINGTAIYARLAALFRAADEKYNAGLFYFRQELDRGPPDELTLGLTLDDKVLKDILVRLYYPDSPYEFSVLSPEILGHVYEQFLGKVVRLTAGHRAVVEEKPEVRKAGGVYYTPAYIVNYIVAHTVGKLLEGRTPADVGPERETKSGKRRKLDTATKTLRVLDPACGSGSFLLGGYQYLLDWHRDWYVKTHEEAQRGGEVKLGSLPYADRIYQGAGGQWCLTIREKKRILLNNIYGVDIDPQAVEVTKLSLLLKVLEGESAETIGSTRRLFQERALPDLSNNIKCGNSLIGPDFFNGRQLNMFDEEDRYRINAFDWRAEFPDAFRSRDRKGADASDCGFDAVIGNPPYIRIQTMQDAAPGTIEYYKRHFGSASKGNYDIYVIFIERGFSLLRPSGRLGMILPNKFFRTDYGAGLREHLATARAVADIVDFGAQQVFQATTYTCLLFLANREEKSFGYAQSTAAREDLFSTRFRKIDASSLSGDAWLFTNPDHSGLLAKLCERSIPLLQLPTAMSRGSSSGDDEVFLVESSSTKCERGILRIPVFATDFGRYRFAANSQWRIAFPYARGRDGRIRLLTENELSSRFPRANRYLRSCSQRLKQRKQFRELYAFSAARNLDLHDKAQILVPLLADRGLCTLVPNDLSGKLCPMASGGFTIALLDGCRLSPEYVLGLLNSKLLFWRLRQTSNIFRGGWVTCTKQYFGQLPIRTIDFSDRADKAHHDNLTSLVTRMLDLQSRLQGAKTAHQRTVLQRTVDATDWQIDQRVYSLYELTDDEIRMVEEATE